MLGVPVTGSLGDRGCRAFGGGSSWGGCLDRRRILRRGRIDRVSTRGQFLSPGRGGTRHPLLLLLLHTPFERRARAPLLL